MDEGCWKTECGCEVAGRNTRRFYSRTIAEVSLESPGRWFLPEPRCPRLHWSNQRRFVFYSKRKGGPHSATMLLRSGRSGGLLWRDGIGSRERRHAVTSLEPVQFLVEKPHGSVLAHCWHIMHSSEGMDELARSGMDVTE